MARYKLSATDVHRGGATVAEFDLDRPSRDAALSDGIIGVLSDNRFPPEVLALYRGALDRNFTRDEALDQILADFGVQFFMKEVANETATPTQPTFTNPQSPASQAPTATQPTLGPILATTPRQMLRAQLAALTLEARDWKGRVNVALKEYHRVKAQVDECRALLAAKRTKKVPTPLRRVRKPLANGAPANV